MRGLPTFTPNRNSNPKQPRIGSEVQHPPAKRLRGGGPSGSSNYSPSSGSSDESSTGRTGRLSPLNNIYAELDTVSRTTANSRVAGASAAASDPAGPPRDRKNFWQLDMRDIENPALGAVARVLTRISDATLPANALQTKDSIHQYGLNMSLQDRSSVLVSLENAGLITQETHGWRVTQDAQQRIAGSPSLNWLRENSEFVANVSETGLPRSISQYRAISAIADVELAEGQNSVSFFAEPAEANIIGNSLRAHNLPVTQGRMPQLMTWLANNDYVQAHTPPHAPAVFAVNQANITAAQTAIIDFFGAQGVEPDAGPGHAETSRSSGAGRLSRSTERQEVFQSGEAYRGQYLAEVLTNQHEAGSQYSVKYSQDAVDGRPKGTRENIAKVLERKGVLEKVDAGYQLAGDAKDKINSDATLHWVAKNAVRLSGAVGQQDMPRKWEHQGLLELVAAAPPGQDVVTEDGVTHRLSYNDEVPRKGATEEGIKWLKGLGILENRRAGAIVAGGREQARDILDRFGGLDPNSALDAIYTQESEDSDAENDTLNFAPNVPSKHKAIASFGHLIGRVLTGDLGHGAQFPTSVKSINEAGLPALEVKYLTPVLKQLEQAGVISTAQEDSARQTATRNKRARRRDSSTIRPMAQHALRAQPDLLWKAENSAAIATFSGNPAQWNAMPTTLFEHELLKAIANSEGGAELTKTKDLIRNSDVDFANSALNESAVKSGFKNAHQAFRSEGVGLLRKEGAGRSVKNFVEPGAPARARQIVDYLEAQRRDFVVDGNEDEAQRSATSKPEASDDEEDRRASDESRTRRRGSAEQEGQTSKRRRTSASPADRRARALGMPLEQFTRSIRQSNDPDKIQELRTLLVGSLTDQQIAGNPALSARLEALSQWESQAAKRYNSASLNQAQLDYATDRGEVWDDMERDGNCLFHALSARDAHDRSAEDLRAFVAFAVGNFSQQQVNELVGDNTPQSLQQTIAQDGNYSEETMVTLAAYALGLNIDVVTENGVRTDIRGDAQNPGVDIVLGLADAHYYLLTHPDQAQNPVQNPN